MRQIPNDELKKTDVPAMTASWPEIESFALSLNGYKAIPRDSCIRLANEVHEAFLEEATIPHELTLTELRACLFFEQRWYHQCDAVPEGGDLAYLRALLDSICEKAETDTD